MRALCLISAITAQVRVSRTPGRRQITAPTNR
jgi:hypothetical protein